MVSFPAIKTPVRYDTQEFIYVSVTALSLFFPILAKNKLRSADLDCSAWF